MLKSGLRNRLLSGERLYGVFCELPCPEAVEIIGAAGWDYAVVDCEHAPIVSSMLPGFMRAGDAAGIAIVVRVPENSAAWIQQALDAGAAGVVIPQIASAEAARYAVAAARFYPAGLRGFNPFVRAARYSSRAVSDFIRDEPLLILQIESSAALESLDSILAAGADALFVGPYDLSQSLGAPGAVDDPGVLEAGRKICAQAEARGMCGGVFVNSEEGVRTWRALGARLIAYSVDTVQLLTALELARTRIMTAIGE
jgi:4-hydroxy-2-oxoheptanedioate aldolase